MDDLTSEKEQIEQIRAWWAQYGGYVIGGIGLGVALLVGYNYWQSSKLEAQLQGSALYESLTEHVVTGNLDRAELVAAEIGTDYAGTTYAAQSKLALARLYMDKNRDQDAADTLSEVLDSDADEAVKLVARARLARVLLYQGKAQEVVDLLEGQTSAAFAAIFNEILGDAYQQLGRIEDAQAAYQSVLLDPVSQVTVDQQLVQWKAADLPSASEPAMVEPSEEPVEEMTEEPVETDENADTAEGGEGE